MRILLLFCLTGLSQLLWAQTKCNVYDLQNAPTHAQNDALGLVLRSVQKCPTNVQELKALLLSRGDQIEPAMVANRGRHNPELGSFSFFETVRNNSETRKILPGDFFFGHFTKAVEKEIILDQQPASGKLLIEALAWDPVKKVYNFYELIGEESSAHWFFRGDSLDILKDNSYIHRDPPPHTPKYGRTLRCSACHSSGGPIMKELEFPHNDWWTKSRPLEFGSNNPSNEIKTWLTDLVDASTFSEYVKAGIEKLELSPTYQQFRSKISLQEQLRPLFCENEINLESDVLSGFEWQQSPVQIPVDFIASPLLTNRSDLHVTVERNDYQRFLTQQRMKFPETEFMDADHAWLVPVKGFSDLLAIQSLIDHNVVDEKFVADVLAVDFQNPLFSKKRCHLLKLLPDTTEGNWRESFTENLKQSQSPEALQLLEYLQNPKYTMRWHQNNVREYLLRTQSSPSALYSRLLNQRKAAFSSEISKNPLGQILEPGFRVIFPVPNSL